MSADYKGLVAFRGMIQSLINDMPAIMDQLAVGEGTFAVQQAVNICQEKKVDNTSFYKEGFKAAKHATKSGTRYRVPFYNNVAYAKHIEYGFRSHFVPGHWEGNTFVYNKKDPEGGMYVGPKGGYVPGKFVFRTALQRVEDTKDARLKRKLDDILEKYMNAHLKGG